VVVSDVGAFDVEHPARARTATAPTNALSLFTMSPLTILTGI